MYTTIEARSFLDTESFLFKFIAEKNNSDAKKKQEFETNILKQAVCVPKSDVAFLLSFKHKMNFANRVAS